ncbi:Nudix family hydrolase [Accumulibacter sp.]|uniref:Nudix family hydrolase n=1 Tax=Accumulibacter sp. TaxID=2053492 RepID=UPI00260AE891|nr:Nudix family hydrolase [Accumulibacter sp.]
MTRIPTAAALGAVGSAGLPDPPSRLAPVGEVTEVAAAVLLRGHPAAPEFLMAQRPTGKVYAGYWEFPGGKVEAGESVREALVRELHEELGITVDRLWPWVCCEFTYPHATVRLRFFRVSSWHGQVTPLEHSAFAWLKVGEAPSVAPILPANGPILRALDLPAVYALSNAEENGPAAELARLAGALAQGLRLLQLRDKTLAPAQRRSFAGEVMALARRYQNARVLVNDDQELARAVGAHGLHLSSTRLWQVERRPDFDHLAASCHSAADLLRAAQLGLDFAVLGPVLPTPSHPGLVGIGWPEFSRLVERSPLPVYALGGLQPEMLDLACSNGGHGVALMRGWR